MGHLLPVERGEGKGCQAKAPWQCLYFLPEPQGQASLRPTLPQVAGFFGSRFARRRKFMPGGLMALVSLAVLVLLVVLIVRPPA